MGRARRWTDDELRQAAAESTSIYEIMSKLGYSVSKNKSYSGGSHKKVAERIVQLGIDASKIKGKGWRKGSSIPVIRPKSLDQVLVKNSNYPRIKLKKRLIENGMLENKCQICNIDPYWNGQKLVLRLDHINGINNDNRLENLRVVCPNCDSQLPTFCGRNKKRLALMAKLVDAEGLKPSPERGSGSNPDESI